MDARTREWVFKLARALLLAGARSIVTTVWASSDALSTALHAMPLRAIATDQDVLQAVMAAQSARGANHDSPTRPKWTQRAPTR